MEEVRGDDGWFWRFSEGTWQPERLDMVEECEARILVDGKELVRLLCTDDALEELALGFLYDEGVIESLDELSSLERDGLVIDARMKNAHARPALSRQVVIASGFGGKTLAAMGGPEKVPMGRTFAAPSVEEAMDQMRGLAARYKRTGGIHCSALFDESGLVAAYEDIGRHNTLDKLSGHLLKEGATARDLLLCTTGRISSEMVRKAVRLGASVVASRSAPTAAAVRLAAAARLTVIGYVGKGTLNLYSGSERVHMGSTQGNPAVFRAVTGALSHDGEAQSLTSSPSCAPGLHAADPSEMAVRWGREVLRAPFYRTKAPQAHPPSVTLPHVC